MKKRVRDSSGVNWGSERKSYKRGKKRNKDERVGSTLQKIH
jgi:hypothetical protein